MRASLVAVTVLMLLGSTTATADVFTDYQRPRSNDVITPRLAERIASARRPGDVERVWVYFVDKGIGSDAELRAALPAIRETFSGAALERIDRRGVPLTITHAPVREDYVAGVEATGADVQRTLTWFNAVVAAATGAEIDAIAALPYVAAIDVVRGRTVVPDPVDLLGRAPGRTDRVPETERGQVANFYGLAFTQYDKIQVDEAHAAGYTGKGVRILMLDSGFDKRHPVFHDTELVGEHDFVQDDDVTWSEPDGSPPDRRCDDSHGTSTWSLTGGYYPGTMVGVAFEAEFAVGRTEYAPTETHGEEDFWAEAVQWSFDEVGADIISSSLGYRYDFDSGGDYTFDDLDGKTTIVAQAANVATQGGILVVNSAGNEGRRGAGSINSPSDSDSVLAIGAIDARAEEETEFSSIGPVAPACDGCPSRIKPNVMAPGIEVYGANAEDCGFFEDEIYNGFLAGTSFSCPITAGAAALILEAHPTWTPHQIRNAFQETTRESQEGINPSTTKGWGAIRVLDAIEYDTPSAPALPMPFDLISPEPFVLTETPAAASTPAFEWYRSLPGRDPRQSQYTVEVATDFEFTDVIATIDADVDTTASAAAPIPEGFYYWRVKSAPSAASSFVRESRQRTRFLIDVAPEPFALLTPAEGDTVRTTLRPTLTWEASKDTSPGDTLRYAVTYDTSPTFDARPRTFGGITSTSFTIPAGSELGENRKHYWKVSVKDRFGAAAGSSVQSFFVAPFPPGPFTLTTPADGDTVSTLRPTLTWTASVDPSPTDVVRYRILMGSSPTSMTALQSNTILETSIRVPLDRLVDDRAYYWTVIAVDSFGNETAASDTFLVRTLLGPQPFALTTPEDGAIVYRSRPTFRWDEAHHERAGETVTYRLEVSDTPTFSTLLVDVPDLDTPVTVLREDLPDAGTFYWRVQARDSADRATWSTDVFSFEKHPAPDAFVVSSGPNPFIPERRAFAITYDVPAELGGAVVDAAILDVSGRVIRRLDRTSAAIGSDRELLWDGRADNGSRVPAGVYYVRLAVGPRETIERVVLLAR